MATQALSSDFANFNEEVEEEETLVPSRRPTENSKHKGLDEYEVESDKDDEHDDDHQKILDEQQKETFFDVATKSLKRKMKRVRAPAHLDPTDAAAFVHNVIDKMHEAADADNEAVEKGLPGLAKVRLMEKVAPEILKPKWTFHFLNNGLCVALAKWLAPTESGKFPSLTLENDLVRNSEIGKNLMRLWRCETDPNLRVQIESIVSQWALGIIGARTSLKRLRTGGVDGTNKLPAPPPEIAAMYRQQILEAKASQEEEEAGGKKRGYGRYSFAPSRVYRVEPRSDFCGEKKTKEDPNSSRAKLVRKIRGPKQ
eukprot:GHVR01133114.1.p1 GENE.GHVR01133114.1~~GHVR01133114.1.p1  ORF type:complete len:312 (+),score=74.98 GHVR01133114.1:66-1001(+)